MKLRAALLLLVLPSTVVFAGEPSDLPRTALPPHLEAQNREAGVRPQDTDGPSLTSTWRRGGRVRIPGCDPPPAPESHLWGTDGIVHAIERSGQTIYIGGSFSSIASTTGGGVPLRASTGQVVRRFPKVNGDVNAIVTDGRSGWFIGGFFTEVDGLPRGSLAHITNEGRVSNWRADAAPFVFALLLKGDTLFVGGRFLSFSGQVRTHLAAVDARTGKVLSWAPNPGGEVHALFLHRKTLYVGGRFTGIGGQHRTFLAGLDVDTGLATDWNPNPYGAVFSIAANDTTVFAGGHFTILAGQGRNFLAAIDAQTGNLRSWNPDPNGSVFTLRLVDTTLFALGWFNTIGGKQRNGAAALDVTTSEVLPWVSDPALGRVVALAVDGRQMYAGWYQADRRRHGAARLNIETGAARGWNTETNDYVNTLAVEGDELYMGGNFSRAGSGAPRANLAALSAKTGEVLPWDPSPDGAVAALVSHGHTLYVGGSFSNIGGQPLAGLAAVDVRDGRAMKAALGTDGSVEVLRARGAMLYIGGSFSRVGELQRHNLAAVHMGSHRVTSWDVRTNGPVQALAVDRSRVYVGGEFTTVGDGHDSLMRNHLAAVGRISRTVLPWDPSPSARVTVLALSGDRLYIGGRFSSVGGLVRDALAAVDARSGETLPWDPQPDWLGIHEVPRGGLAVAGPTVYVGGSFASIGGAYLRGFAALDARSGQATCWDARTDLPVTTIAPYGPRLYLGGYFGRAGGYPTDHFAGFLIPGTVADRDGGRDRLRRPARPLPVVAFSVTNPLRGQGEFRFSLSEATTVSLSVYDIHGRRVTSMVDREWRAAGDHVAEFRTAGWPPGVYLWRLRAGTITATGKVALIE